MATIMSDAHMGTWAGIAAADETRTAFTQHKKELTWVAEFLTGDEVMASACVVTRAPGVRAGTKTVKSGSGFACGKP
jgi:hypothetical protein